MGSGTELVTRTLVRLHVHLTKAGTKNLCKRRLLSGLCQIALDGRYGFAPTFAHADPQGRRESSVASGNQPERKDLGDDGLQDSRGYLRFTKTPDWTCHRTFALDIETPGQTISP